MRDIFYVVMKVKRSRVTGGARAISAKRVSKKLPRIQEDSVVLRLEVDIPFDVLGQSEPDTELPLDVVELSCHLVNYGGR